MTDLHTALICAFRTVLVVVSIIVIAGPADLRADDQIDSLDRQLLEALEGTITSETPQQIIPRLIDNSRQAADRLQEGHLGPDTQKLQTRILADLDALLEQSPPPAQPPRDGASSPPQGQQSQDSQRQQQDSSQQSPPSQQDGQSDPGAASQESEERNARGSETDAERDRRLGLSTAAWGHLPPKVREQMRSAFSEEYLPQYDALVRRYYEALARRRAGQR